MDFCFTTINQEKVLRQKLFSKVACWESKLIHDKTEEEGSKNALRLKIVNNLLAVLVVVVVKVKEKVCETLNVSFR